MPNGTTASWGLGSGGPVAQLVSLRDFLSEKLFLAWKGRSQGMKASPLFSFAPNCLAAQ